MLAIYNHYVEHSTVTFDERPMTLHELLDKFEHLHALRMPFLVAEAEPGAGILGYAHASPWRQKAAYRFTAESSIYLRADAIGRGIGTALLLGLIDRARASGLRQLIAIVVDQGAEASLALHRSQGFIEVGRLHDVGYKFDRWLGTILLQKSLE